MALELADRWVWDFWFAKDGGTYHIFFLQAPRSLGDPDLRHRNASVGHATSVDLVTWTEVGTAIEAGYPGDWDDVAIWTGSIIKHDGRWWMFYTGTSHKEEGLIQRIGAAVSDDLNLWIKHPSNPLLYSHPYWYEQLDSGKWHDQAWRDPWVYQIEDGVEMLITARIDSGPSKERGVIGRAFSTDLTLWSAVSPLTAPGSFGQMEVSQRLHVDGADLLLFSCEPEFLGTRRAAAGEPQSNCYALWLDGPGTPHPADNAIALDTPDWYSVRAVKDPGDEWVVLGVEQDVDTGGFAGRIGDPLPLDAVLPPSIRVASGD